MTIFDQRYETGSYDMILAFSILHLGEGTPEVIRRIYELLEPGGIFISAAACLGVKRGFVGILRFILSKIGLVQIGIRFKSLNEKI
jgi:hypothetical protein